jgi:hypothetical protein
MLFKDISFPWQATAIFLDSLWVMQVSFSQTSDAEIFNILGCDGIAGWVVLDILKDCSAFIFSDCLTSEYEGTTIHNTADRTLESSPLDLSTCHNCVMLKIEWLSKNTEIKAFQINVMT